MRLCIPATKNKGIESPVSPHFGSAAFFVIVDSDTLGCEAVTNVNQHHAHGMCQPLASLQKENFDAIVVGGIGMGALNKLRAAGKRVYRTGLATIKDTVEAFRKGELIEVTPDMACAGHH
jgi:predicted Fe-Mo cluster-binding NifX family protein